MSSFDSEPISVLQKYSDIRLNKQSIINTSNSDEGSLQSNYSITEAGLFRNYINIDFPPFSINMDTSELGPVLEITRIFRLKQMVISDSDASKVFSQMNLDFKQSLLLPLKLHSQQWGYTDNLAPSSAADMQVMLQIIL